MAAYRCLRSAGFLLTAINCQIEHDTLRCGLILIPQNMGAFPIRMTDVDSDQQIGKLLIPEDYQNQGAPTWLHSPLDDLEFEFITESPP